MSLKAWRSDKRVSIHERWWKPGVKCYNGNRLEKSHSEETLKVEKKIGFRGRGEEEEQSLRI